MGKLDDAVCIFDLDGTLVDSAPDLTAALNRQLVKLGLDAMAPDEVRPLVGEGARALLRHSFEAQGRAFPEGETADTMVAAYIDDYAERICEHSRLFDGVENCLKRLTAEGAELAVCTNKTERLAGPLLEKIGIREHFGTVIGADSLSEKKPSPTPLFHILEASGRTAGVMIGDTMTDRLAGEAAGMPVLVYRFGYGMRDERLASSTIFETFRDVPGLVSSVLGRTS